MSTHLKNTKTGVVFAASPLLRKLRPDLVSCNKDGKVTHVSVVPTIETKLLLNPVTRELSMYSPELAARPGMIGINSQVEADEILKGLGAFDAPALVVGGSQEPIVPVPDAPVPQSGLVPPLSADDNADEEEEDQTGAETGGGVPEGADSQGVDLQLMLDAVQSNDEKALRDMLKQFALTHFDEKLDGRAKPQVMREQIQIMINNHAAQSAA